MTVVTLRELTHCTLGQNISALTTGAPVDRSRDSIRKRRRGEDDIVETQPKRQKPPGNQAQPSRAFTVGVSALTSQNLKRLSHQVHSQHFPSAEEIALGQPGFVNMPKSQRTETKSRQTEETSSSTKTVSSSDSRFQKIAAKNGVLVPMDSTEPSNLDDIYNYLNRPRESVSPDFEEFKSYRWKAVTADNEDTVKLALIRHLKEYDDGKYRSAYNQQFTEYPANVGFNDGLSPAKPDLVQGINLQNFEPYPVVQELGGAAVPTPSRYPIALAHMAGEFKRPGGNLIEAQSQAAYDAASLVYGRNVARESMNRADPPSAAHVGSFISDGTHITTFTHYATKDASGKIVYHQWPVTDTNIQLGYQSFKTGRRQVRNLQDWTRENSYLLKKELLDHYKLSQTRNNESIPEGVVCREYRNSCSSTGSSVALGSEPYVVVDGPTQLKSLPTFEAEDLYVTPHSSDPARSRRHERLTSPVDMETRVPKQRNKRSSARLLERRHRQNRD